MRPIRILTALLVIPCLLSAARAEVLSDTLGWNDCVDTALRANPSLFIAKYGKEASEYDYRTAINGYLPQLGLSYSGNRSGEPGNSSWGLSLSASETLFSAKTNSTLRLRKTTVNKAEVSVLAASAQAQQELKTAFVNMIYAQENIRVLEGIHKLRASNADMIRMRYEGGRESKGNMMRSAAQAERSRLDIEAAKRSLLTARRNLAEVMGLDSFGAFTVTGTLADLLPAGELDINSSAQANPNVRLSALSLEIAKEQVSNAASDIYPTLSASQSLGWSGDNPTPEYRNWSLGLRLSLPIFSNGVSYVYNNTRSARSQLKQSEETYRQTLLSIKSDLQTAHARFANAHDSVASSKLFLSAADQRHKEATVQYFNGTLNFDIWEGIEQELVNAEKDHLSALKEINLSKTALEGLLGAPLSY